MQPATNFRDLIVWRKAHQYVLAIYQLTAGFPKQETYGLAAQMRRAAVSAAANIAEGFGKRGKADKARFMNIAEGSIEEAGAPGFWLLTSGFSLLNSLASGFWLLTSDS